MPSVPAAWANRTTSKSSPQKPSIDAQKRRWFGQRIATKQVVEFTRSFAVMLAAKMPLLEALQSVGQQHAKSALGDVVAEVKKGVQGGRSLSQSLARRSDVFDSLYVQMVQVGEAAGILDQVLLRLATYLEKGHMLRRKVGMALVYPALILTVALGAVTFLLTVIVPTFAEMYADFGAELPGPTQVVLALSHALRDHWLWVLGGGAGLYLLARTALQTPRGRAVKDKLVLRLPVFGGLLQKSLLARFCRTLGTLLQSGVALVDALATLQSTADNVHLQRDVAAMQNALQRGKRLTQSLRQSVVFPMMVIQMIAVGEETARLDDMLLHIADHYEQDVDVVLDSLTAIIEPIIIVILGVVLGSILVAMYLPLFDLTTIMG